MFSAKKTFLKHNSFYQNGHYFSLQGNFRNFFEKAETVVIDHESEKELSCLNYNDITDKDFLMPFDYTIFQFEDLVVFANSTPNIDRQQSKDKCLFTFFIKNDKAWETYQHFVIMDVNCKFKISKHNSIYSNNITIDIYGIMIKLISLLIIISNNKNILINSKLKINKKYIHNKQKIKKQKKIDFYCKTVDLKKMKNYISQYNIITEKPNNKKDITPHVRRAHFRTLYRNTPFQRTITVSSCQVGNAINKERIYSY